MGIPMYGAGVGNSENGDNHNKSLVGSANTLATEPGRPLHCAFCFRAAHVVAVCPYTRYFNRATAAADEAERRRRFYSMALARWFSDGQTDRGAPDHSTHAPSRQDENGPNGRNSSSRQ